MVWFYGHGCIALLSSSGPPLMLVIFRTKYASLLRRPRLFSTISLSHQEAAEIHFCGATIAILHI